MKNFIKYISSSLNDPNGDTSSKRLITFLAFTLLSCSFLLSLFIEVKLPEYMWDGVIVIICAGLGASTIDHFSSKTKNNETDIDA